MEENKVQKQEKLQISKNEGTQIKTDKVKYEVNDDINIKLNSSTDLKDKKIVICKNEKVLQMISTDQDDVTVNLEEIYGLIDICVLNGTKIERKRTIFIKPNKELKVAITTNQENYQPGDNLNLQIDLSDENGNKTDGAMLVSIIDEAVLSIGDNDLSIDNIKLALKDIKFSEDLDAATLYANIVNNESETALMGLLLKQSSKDINISIEKLSMQNERDETIEMLVKVGFALVVVFVIGAIIIGLATSKEISSGFMHLIAYIGTLLYSILLIGVISKELDGLQIFGSIILSILAYGLYLYQYKNTLFKITLEYTLAPIVAFTLAQVLSNLIVSSSMEQILIIECMVVTLIWVISLILKKHNIKPKLTEKISKITMNLIKVAITFILAIVFEDVEPIFTLIILTLLNLGFEIRVNKPKKSKIQEIEIYKAILIIGVAVIFIVIIALSVLVLNGSNGMIRDANLDSQEDIKTNYSSGGVGPTDAIGSISADTSTSSTNKDQGFDLSSITDNLFGENQKENNVQIAENEDTGKIDETETTEQEEQEENIRNVFLESLCFIPELVTENGTLNTNIQLSDNITSWKIQTVGNTKDGRIGYGTKNITVTKEFFANFTTPSNCVVGDNISIPVTIYNYTDNQIFANIEVPQVEWFEIGEFEKQITVEKQNTKMVYVPITIKKSGNNTLRVEAKANEVKDILEKQVAVKENGLEVSKVVSTGKFENTLSQDIIYNENAKAGTKNLKVKLYPSPITQAIEGIESILRMPTGCFEQVSSSLYPDILVLKYLAENKIENETIKQKALGYIQTGYQKLLTYEVAGEKGGYSLYGKSPAKPVLTAYGLMEIKDLSTVYNVDENVIKNMEDYLYKKQKSNGSFNLEKNSGSFVSSKTDELTLNAYVIWALSEANPEDSRLQKSISYLENNIDKMEDTYTMSLAANALANVDSKIAKTLVDRLMNKVQINGDKAYIQSNITDYYGTRGTTQNLQTVCLTSLALTKLDMNVKTNQSLINYIISAKDSRGTWNTTQGTILALKAIIGFSNKSDIKNQTITVSVNDNVQTVEIDEQSIDLYELSFNNLDVENHLNIEMKKGKMYYEIVEEYVTDYQNQETAGQIETKYTLPAECNVNEVVTQNVEITNKSNDIILNGMTQITIPQGFKVLEESLSKLVATGKIEKYEYNYSKIYLYMKDLKINANNNLQIQYMPLYPGNITGGAVRSYDYYNPDVEGFANPIQIKIK